MLAEGFDARLTAARPQALAALTRAFRDLDSAEEAFQEACLRALQVWPDQGLPRDPTAWLIRVGRNFGIDQKRRGRRLGELPAEERLSDTGDTEAEVAERLDRTAYRDDVLRLLFICCHPELPAAHQVALALRIVTGLSVREIARAFLVGERAMEQRITRAKKRVGAADVPFGAPSAEERAERLQTVATMIYLLFNEGYSASGGDAQIREPLCDEAIRLARLLRGLFPGEGELAGLLALCLLHHARRRARLDSAGGIVLLEDQDRSLWEGPLIVEGQALVEEALRRRRSGPRQAGPRQAGPRQAGPRQAGPRQAGPRQAGPFLIQAAIAAVHGQARRPAETDWAEIDRLYEVLERAQPSPVVSLNRAVAMAKVRGPAAALQQIEPLDGALAEYFHYHGVRAAFLAEIGDVVGARGAFERALDLARTPAEAGHIRDRLAALG